MTFTSCGRLHTIYIVRSRSVYYAVRFESVEHIEAVDCVFHDNYGTALGIFNSRAAFSGNNTFSSNCRRCSDGGECWYSICYGGGIYVEASGANFSGITTFDGNYDSGIYALDNSDVSFNGNTTFKENSAEYYGGGIYAWVNSDVSFSGTTTFKENSAGYGGGIFAWVNSDVSFSGSTSFKENSAVRDGGGIYAWVNSDVSFSGTTTFKENSAEYGGGILAWNNSDVSFSGSTSFKENSAVRDGGGIYAWVNSDVRFSDTGTISDNTAEDGGGISTYYSIIDISGNITVRNNTARQYGGGIYMSRTNLTVAGTNKFTNNSAREGGGIYAAANSNLDFDGMNTFNTNRADIRGGGIWVDNGNLTLNGSSCIVRCTAGIEGGGMNILHATINLPGNNKFISNSAISGGGISARWSHFLFTNSSHFSNNSAADTGGGISTIISTLVFGGKNTFDNNAADLGGGIYMWNSSLDFWGENYFNLNLARRDGGGIYGRDNGTINLSGSNSFYDNEAEVGGGMFIDFGRLCLSGSSLFHKNKGTTGGGLYSFNSVLEFFGVHNFTTNSALDAGGGFATVYSTVNLAGNTTFQRNSALTGGAIYMEDTQVNLNGTNHFIHDNAHYDGGAVYMQAGKINISGRNVFKHNSAALRGGSLFAAQTSINFTGSTIICDSMSPEGAGIHVVSSSIIFEGRTQFQNNFAYYGGAVFSENSRLTFAKRKERKAEFCYHCRVFTKFDPAPCSSFISNTALRGGAMHLDHQSSMYIHPYACMLFENNTAKEDGGAIYVIDITGSSTGLPVLDLPSRNECFAHIISNKMSETGKINLTFQGNTAGKSGSVLYGGMLNKCNNSYSEENPLHLFISSIKDDGNASEVAAISSDPVLCFCTEGRPHERKCNKVKSINAFPGQKVNVSVIAFDQTGTPIQTEIDTNLISDEKDKSCVCEVFSQEREELCTNRSYIIKSPITTSELLLYPTAVSGSPTPAVLNIAFQNCPIGFENSNSTNECICDHRLQMFNITCNIDSQTILRTGEMSFWVNASYENESFEGYISHPQCPLNYCTKKRKHINLNNPDEQCDSNHSGLLCGSCKENFSFILGSSQCRKCSNEYLALLIPFALAGVALVILLFVLNLTVTTGTLHGLIFYANIIAANHQIFFSLDSTIAARIFIACLNLDLATDTCFYHGMDAYCKLWLQFVFPLYIWGIVGFLIYISRRSPRFTRLLGTNPVAVLGTLFLLSYTKLLRTVITALSLTTLQYPNNDSRIVWLYDPSVPIPKLIPFFLVALIFLVLLLFPYTLLLLLGQWLWTKTKRHPLSCWRKYPRLKLRLKTILDPYYAPYKSECRYWTGLFLVLRFFLFLVSAFNISGDKNSANLLAILVIVIISLVVFGLSGRVYKSWCLNALEVSFLLNLGVFAAGTYHVNLTAGDQAAITYTSVGVAFLTFVGIVAYHAHLRLKAWKPQFSLCSIMKGKKRSCDENNEENDAEYHQMQTWPQGAPTTTIVDLNELRSPLNLITN